jgi:hypothetical protein
MADHGSNRERANSAGDVVLVLNAGSDAGFQIARDLLDSGCRVAAELPATLIKGASLRI